MGKVLLENQAITSLLSENQIEDACKLFDKATSVIFFLYNVKSRNFVFVTNSIQSILGYPAQRLVDEGLDFVASQIHPEDYPVALEVCAKMNGRRHDFPKCIELRIKSDQGGWIQAEIEFMVSRNRTMRINHIFGVLKDVSSEKMSSSRDKVDQSINRSTHSTHDAKEDVVKKPAHQSPSISNVYKRITRREKEVLKLIGEGFSAKQVAEKLFISIHTAINHRKNLITKFHAKNTAHLIKMASRNFWL